MNQQAAPFKPGDSVKDRFGGTVRGTVVSLSLEQNGLGEPYWFVIVRDQRGEFGLDSRDIVQA